jgi:hypothetical protein
MDFLIFSIGCGRLTIESVTFPITSRSLEVLREPVGGSLKKNNSLDSQLRFK